MLSAFRERRGWSTLNRLPTDQQCLALLDDSRTAPRVTTAEAVLEHFQSRFGPFLLRAFVDREKTISAMKVRWPQAPARIIEKADRILVGRFDLLGLRNLYFGSPIDWQLEPVSGKRAPSVHW